MSKKGLSPEEAQKLLEQKLESLKEKVEDEDVAFTNTFAITLEESPVIENSNHDPRREKAFQEATLKGVLAAREKMEKIGIKYERPPDNFVEMIKDERQMAAATKRLEEEQKKIQNAQAKNKQEKIVKQVPKDNTQKRPGVLLKPKVSLAQKRKDAKKNRQ